MEGAGARLRVFPLVCLLLLSTLHCGSTQTLLCKYHETYNVSTYSELQVDVTLNSAAVVGSSFVPSAVTLVKFEGTFITPSGGPDITIERSVEMYDATMLPPKIQLTTKLSHNTGAGTLTGVVFEEDISPGLQADWPSSLYLNATGRTHLYYTPSDIASGSSVTTQFKAEPSGDQGTGLPSGYSFFDSDLSFNYSVTGDSFPAMPLQICLFATYKYNPSVFYQHGFTALTFFFAMLLGFLLVTLAAFLFFCVWRRRKGASVTPSGYDDNRLREKGKKIVMDPKAALRKGLNVIKDYSLMGWNESIVLVLSLKDKLHMFREIDNLDVLATMHVDQDMEKEQNDAAIQTSLLLVQGLRQNGDLSKGSEDKAVGAFTSNLKDLDRKLDAEYRKELEVVYTDLSAKNKEKLAELLQKHRQQKQQTTALTKDLPDKERQGLMKLVDEQQNMEENELTFTLALEQNEGAEKLRKEFAIRKRMGIKELQQGMMSEVISQGQLQHEQADWLLKEHKKQQEAIHRMYDEETSRQRMVLEEKLARRRALAHASETQEDDGTETLNMTAGHVIDCLQKARKNSLLTAEQSEEWIEELKASALNIKTEMETATEMQEKDLHKKLSQTKMSRLNELMKKHEAEIQNYIKANKSQQTDGPVDPVSYSEGLLKMRSGHRVELSGLENQLDGEHAQQLAAARTQVAKTAQDKLAQVQRETITKLQTEGLTDKVVATMMKKQEAEREGLLNKQQKNRRNQEDKLKEELARRKREWAARREKERQEQEDLREHEAEVVEKLVNSQVSMSEAERDRIMKEHEKQMVLLENSLTLNKLRQQRSLEERLNEKRAQQMGRLQTQQQSESLKQRKVAENNGEEDDEATHRAALELMKKHAQQRIAVMQGNQLDIDEELEQIRVEMTKDRALALKGQEERLGAMISALQMEKAREMTRIEEQQKAINNLKANLMDDLNDRGILSTPECERILEVHKQESESLNGRLENQRNKQEQMLRAKLQERMQQRETVLLAQHESEMKTAMQGAGGNKFSSKVRRVMLIHKHMVAMEKFRNRMEREISQSLADIKRQFEVTKLQKLQEQELAFVAGLVRVGCFEQNELLDVLHMLFPGKTEEEIQQVLALIMDGVQKPADKDMKKSNWKSSTIVARIYRVLFSNAPVNRSVKSAGKKKKKKLSKQESRLSLTNQGLGTFTEPDYIMDSRMNGSAGTYDRRNNARNYDDDSYDDDSYNRRDSARRFSQDDYNPSYDQGVDFIGMGASMTQADSAAARTGRLAPLEQSTSKKKKKKGGLLKKHRQQYNDDDR